MKCWPRILLLVLAAVMSACCITGQAHAQQTGANDTMLRAAVIYNGDTIEAKTMGTLLLYAWLPQMSAAERAAYDRLRNAVLVTYPYARRAADVINDINRHLLTVTKKVDRKKYIRSREKELRRDFSDPLTNLSVYQGRVLMKLINRETGNNCYEIIKEYKGGLNARMYQTVAFFFNSSLKQSYDAGGEDALAEKFVYEAQRRYGYYDNVWMQRSATR